MKKAAIVVLVFSFFFLSVFLFGQNKGDHKSSPAFSASLMRATEMLEGTFAEVTAAATPHGAAKADYPTQSDYTCVASPGCDPTNEPDVCGPTLSEYTCDYFLTCWSTCDYYSGCEPTGNLVCGPTLSEHTCEYYATCEFTCKLNPDCQPTGDLVCEATVDPYTCEGRTCDEFTCKVYPDCEPTGGLVCEETFDYTCDGNVTCEYTCSEFQTCEYTCEYHSGCEPTGAIVCPTSDTCVGQPGCPSSGTGRTSWGFIKDMF